MVFEKHNTPPNGAGSNHSVIPFIFTSGGAATNGKVLKNTDLYIDQCLKR